MQRLAGDLYLFQHTSFLWVDYCFDVTFSFEFSQRGFTTLWFTRCPFCVLSTKKQTFLMGGEFQRMVHTSHLQAPWRHVRVHRKKRNSDTEMDDQWRNILWGLGTLRLHRQHERYTSVRGGTGMRCMNICEGRRQPRINFSSEGISCRQEEVLKRSCVCMQ